MSWYDFIKDIFNFFRSKKNKEYEEKIEILKNRIKRYFENAQINVNGSFTQSEDGLSKSNLFNSEEIILIPEALRNLCAEGILEYEGGTYYLKGHAPKL